MKIVASQRGKLLRERAKYVEDYEARKGRYDEQVNLFERDKANYASDMENYVKTFLSDELAKLPGTNVSVKTTTNRENDLEYYVFIYYSPDKGDSKKYRDRDYYHDVSSGYYNGFKWNFTIYIKTEFDGYDENGNSKYIKTLEKAPVINANIVDATDYEALKYTYELFSKIETLDWEAIINKINSSVPERDKYVTEPNPGRMDTSSYDAAITHYTISRIIGKDIWIKVDIKREESYDRWNSNYGGVDGWGWIQVISATEKFYTFHWLEGDRAAFDVGDVARAQRRDIKLKKIYIYPQEPVEYATTEELTAESKPSLD